jgi:phosphoesterase RecJ-like protein
MVLDRQTQRHFFLQEGDTEGFVNLPLAIRKVRMSLFLREENGVFRVSIRSKKGTSANTLATRYFCGCGHELAAGGKFIPTRDRDKAAEAEAFIERITEEFLSE